MTTGAVTRKGQQPLLFCALFRVMPRKGVLMEKIHPITEYLKEYHAGERNIVSCRELEVAFQISGPELRTVINADR